MALTVKEGKLFQPRESIADVGLEPLQKGAATEKGRQVMQAPRAVKYPITCALKECQLYCRWFLGNEFH